LGKEAHERALHAASLSTRLVCCDQETGRSSCETAPEEPTASQNSRVRQCGASKRGNRPPHSIISKYVTKLTKHRILQDALRDRQTASTNAAFFMKCSGFVSQRMVRMDDLRSQYNKRASYSHYRTDGQLMICKAPNMIDRSATCSVSCIFLFLPLALFSRTAHELRNEV